MTGTDTQPEGLISVLRDRNARGDERDDAAMDLGSYDDVSALNAVLAVAVDPDEDDTVAAAAGESLAEM